jgi:signal transduction histidine kinase
MKATMLISICLILLVPVCHAQGSADGPTRVPTSTAALIAQFDSLLADGSNLRMADERLAMLHTDAHLDNHPAQKPWILYYEALSLFYKSNYIQSTILLQQASSILNAVPEDDQSLLCKARVTNLTGLNYSNINDWENAQQYYQNALTYALQTRDSSLIARIYLNTAYIFIDVQDWKNAAVNLYKGLDYTSATGSKDFYAGIYSNLANANIMLGNSNESLKYVRMCDSIFSTHRSTRAGLFNNLCHAEYSYFKNNCPRAREFATESLRYAKLLGDSVYLCVALEQLARMERCNKNYTTAAVLIRDAGEIADRRNYLGVGNIVHYERMMLQKETGDYKAAFETALRMINLTDSLAAAMNNNRRIINDVVFESSQKERKIQSLSEENKIQQLEIRQKNTLNYLLFGGALTILTISILVYRNYRHRQKIQAQKINELEKEKLLAAAESVLKGEELERTRLAKELHDGLGGMLSGIKFSLTSMKENLLMTPDNRLAFERSLDMLDSSIQEMRRVAHNMMPEALVKFGLETALEDFCGDITQSGALNVQFQSLNPGGIDMAQTTAISVYRIVQELINNTIKYASAQNALVQISASDGIITLEVEDDGKGFDTGILERSKGIGWTNIKNRVEFLKGKIDIHSQPGKGTSVHIEYNG